MFAYPPSRAALRLLLSLLPALSACPLQRPAHATGPDERGWEVVRVEGVALRAFAGTPVDRLAVLRCRSECEPIPFQVDERTADGRWALDEGAQPSRDDPAGVFDANDVLLFMAADSGARTSRDILPRGPRIAEIELTDPLGFPSRWVYVAAYDEPPPRSSRTYVDYDPGKDRISGTQVQLGFSAGMPQHLAVGADGANVLDRLKVRARASFFFDLISVERSEGDLRGGPVSWRSGPIRVIRRQQHSIRIGFGIRSPGFGSDTFFYRDFAELPVTVTLRVPPRYIFSRISVRTALDFRDLSHGWNLVLPGIAEPIPVRCDSGDTGAELDGRAADWFALRGSERTLLVHLRRGSSLQSVQQVLSYHAGTTPDPPENLAGQCPAAGFVLRDWDAVEGGRHVLESASYALPKDVDIPVFLATVEAPLQIRVRKVR